MQGADQVTTSPLWVADVRRVGFPPADDDGVTLDTWQDPPNQRWAFQHMREIIPTHRIGPSATPSALPTAYLDADAIDAVDVTLWRGDRDPAQGTVGEVLATTWTDAVLVVKNGVVVLERYGPGMSPAQPHLLMSVSKSIVGCVAAALVADGLLREEAPVTAYVPELAGTGYDGASVRDVLDMRTGVRFRETYADLDAEVRVMERSMGWRSREPGDPVGAYAYLRTLGSEAPHGDVFTYRSADTDLLGWVCERAAGERMADLVSRRIWVPLGAQDDASITCDAVGTAIHDGGISASPRDLAKFGLMLGRHGSSADRQVVPATWLWHAMWPDESMLDAFRRSDNESVLTGGWYCNQFWMLPGEPSPVLMCLGIHGQMVYVDFARDAVCVKLSSWPTPQDTAHLINTIRSFRRLAHWLE